MAYVNIRFRTTDEIAEKIVSRMSAAPDVFDSPWFGISRFIGYLSADAKELVLDGNSIGRIRAFQIWKESE